MSEVDQKMVEKILARGCEAFGGEPMCELAVLLSTIRAEALLHQAHHWQTRGPSFYSDHLLFEKLYDRATKIVDDLAERAVGSGDHKLVDASTSAQQVADMVKLCTGTTPNTTPDSYVVCSLKASAMTLSMLKAVYESLSRKGKLSHGTDNLLQDIADKTEKSVYLLKQRCKVK